MAHYQSDATIEASSRGSFSGRSSHSRQSFSRGDSSDARSDIHSDGEAGAFHDAEQSTSDLNLPPHGQPLSTPYTTGQRPREGKLPERSQAPLDVNPSSSQETSVFRGEESSSSSDAYIVERRSYLEQLSLNGTLEAERRLTVDVQPNSHLDSYLSTKPSPQNASIPNQDIHNAGEGSSRIAETTRQQYEMNGNQPNFENPSRHGPGPRPEFTLTLPAESSEMNRSYGNHGTLSGRQIRSASSGSRGSSNSTPALLTNNALYENIGSWDASTIVLPRWQPDAEVTICPICGTQFSFFVRKHHCRKCGRVVCSSCSPHRITIPYQFIVQPPADPAAPGIPSPPRDAPTQSSLSTSDVASLGGGERVRLCNPCVPDPNVAPPQTPRYQNNLQPPLPRAHNRSTSLASSSSNSFIPPTNHDEGDGHNSHHIGLALPQYGFGEHPASYQSIQSQARRSTISATGSGAGSHLQGSASSIGQNRDNGLSRATRGSGLIEAFQQLTTALPPDRIHQQLRQRDDQYRQQRWSPTGQTYPSRQPDDADLCPVCHQRLPTRSDDLAQLEALRERHINECIEAVIRGSRATPPVPIDPPPSAPSSSLPSSSLHPAAQTPRSAAAISSVREQVGIAMGRATTPRRTGVFRYKATEKDCVDDAECTICFEEFEVGVEMGRLECFCRFHFDCIMRWFRTRPGQCPVHQHDGGF